MPPPTRLDAHAWRNDRLGKRLRAGLGDMRRAPGPSPVVWKRIAREIEPPRSHPLLTRAAPRASTDPEVAENAGWLGGLSISSSAAWLTAVMLLALAFVGDPALRAGYAGGAACSGYLDPGCGWDRMSDWERAIQPVDPEAELLASPGWVFRVPRWRLVDRVARARRIAEGYEAYNRAEWLRQPPPPSNGPVVGLSGTMALD